VIAAKLRKRWLVAFASALTAVLSGFENLDKNHLQEPRGFWLLFAGTKSNERYLIESSLTK
jgi:hypothetical protein